MKNKIKTNSNGWIDAHKLPNYKDMLSAVCAVAGDGMLICAEDVGKSVNQFAYSEILLITLKGSEILYSMDREDGSIDVEFVGCWSR